MKQLLVVTIGIVGLLSRSIMGYGQAGRALQIGDTLPDFELNNVLNYTDTKLNLTDLAGTPVILDFWTTGCRGCIESWPKLLALKKEFGDRLTIILVNAWEPAETVTRMFKLRKKLADIDMNLPATYGPDTALRKLFPVSGVPHLVWFNHDGEMVAITGSEAMTKQNVMDLLRDSLQVQNKVPNDSLIIPESYKPLFIDGNGGSPDRIYEMSLFAKATRLYPLTFLYVRKDLGFGGALCNTNILELYALAYSNLVDPRVGDLSTLPHSLIHLDVENPSIYKGLASLKLSESGLFAYQLISPSTDRQKIQELMQADLNKYIGLDVKWVKVKKPCLVISATDTNRMKYTSGKTVRQYAEGIRINKIPVSQLIIDLQKWVGSEYFFKYPILDETGYSGLLGNIEAQVDVADYRELHNVLMKHGMRIQLLEREVDVLRIREPEGYEFPYD